MFIFLHRGAKLIKVPIQTVQYSTVMYQHIKGTLEQPRHMSYNYKGAAYSSQLLYQAGSGARTRARSRMDTEPTFQPTCIYSLIYPILKTTSFPYPLQCLFALRAKRHGTGKNGRGHYNLSRKHFMTKLIIASCFSSPKTPILMYSMLCKFEKMIFHIFTGASKVQKWAWPKMGVGIKIKNAGIAKMIHYSPKYPKPILTPY